MKKSNKIRLGLERGMALAAIGLCTAATTSATAQSTADKPAVQPTKPPLGGPGSLDGLWNRSTYTGTRAGPPAGQARSFKTADGEPIPMLPWAAKVAADRQSGFENGKPYAQNSVRCISNGMPGAIRTPMQQPFEIVETPKQKQITVLYEYFTTFRIINMDQKHPPHPKPSLMGDAVGHWEGDTLVIDTIAVDTSTTMMEVIPHTDALHLVERMRRTGPDTMEDRLTIEDPKTFSKPWTEISLLRRIPGMRIGEFVCDNNRNGADENGETSVKLSTDK